MTDLPDIIARPAWQDISTAPKDGTWFVAYRPESNLGTWARVVIVRWHEEIGDFVWPDEPFDIYLESIDARDAHQDYKHDPYEARGSFTHWMPLPEPPA